MATILPLKNMTRLEKLQAMEELWTDLAKDEDQFESPAWHEQALKEAQRAYEAGEAKFIDWEEAKRELGRKTNMPS